MKLPGNAFNRDAALALLLRHGEKVVAALVGLLACALAWGGIVAVRTMSPSAKQLPQAIIDAATKATAHIEKKFEEDADKKDADKKDAAKPMLAENVKPWITPEIEAAAPHAILNKPLYGELARRSKPTILPIEDVRAVAGVAVLAVKAKPAGGRPVADQDGPQGKVVPYVLVTGLIPVAKQQAEYDRQFKSAGFHDAVRDAPSWNSYTIERTEVLAGTAEKWALIDIKPLARRYSVLWAGFQSEPLLPRLILAPKQERRDPALLPIPFCSPMPQLADGSWGGNALHPWFVDVLQREVAAKNSRPDEEPQAVVPSGDAFGGATGGVFGDASDPPAQPPAAAGPPAGPAIPAMAAGGAAGATPDPAAEGLEYRLFRFIDLEVVPGRTYRYRVKTACGNPNLDVPVRHLVEASIAKPATLASPDSSATTPVIVPDSTRLLVQPLEKQEYKRLKPGVVPAMILGEKPNGETLALRKILMEVGGLANVDPSLNKRGDVRSVGDAIVTDRVLLDVRGKFEDRAEARAAANKPTPPPEPLEMIFLRPDGTFEITSLADSQQDVDRYRATLKVDEPDTAPGDRPGRQPAAVDSPFGNPFERKK